MSDLFSETIPSEDLPIEKQLQIVLKYYKISLHKPYTMKDLHRARKTDQFTTRGLVRRLVFGKRIPLTHISDHFITVELPPGQIRFRFYSDAPLLTRPVIVYFHGGGFTMGSIEFCDQLCRDLAKRFKVHVLSVEYRLAPEFKFPTPLNDCYMVLQWLKEHAEELQCDSMQIYLMGDSAGANAAAMLAIMARDNHLEGIQHQILLYPWVDAQYTRPSIDRFADGYGLTKELMEIFTECYLPEGSDKMNPACFPLPHPNLAGLPPATIITGAYDPLRDQGHAYAEALCDHNVSVHIKCYFQTIHESLLLNRVMPHGNAIYEDFMTTLQTVLPSGNM